MAMQHEENFQEKKRAVLLAQCTARSLDGTGRTPAEAAEFAVGFMERQEHRRLGNIKKAKVRAKLRSLLWRAWATYRPIFGGVALGYTSLREQHVYRTLPCSHMSVQCMRMAVS